MSPRSFATLWMTILAMAAIVSSCTQDDITPAYSDAPLTITATVPGDVWGVATRSLEDGNVIGGDGIKFSSDTFTDWTLHYTDYSGQAATYTWNDPIMNDLSVSLTTDSNLVWAQVDATKPMHLTAVCDNGTTDDTTDDYTLHTSVPSATAGTALVFPDAMKPTLTKLTVKLTLLHNMTDTPTAEGFTITVIARAAAADYDPMTAIPNNAWPVAEGDATATVFPLSQNAADGTYTVTMYLPQQEMDETLTVTYGTTIWTLDLSTVTVSGSNIGQTAHQLIAGQHLTLNLTAGLTNVNSPSDIRIEAFTAADANSYNPDLGGMAKTYEYDAATNTYFIYHEKYIAAALEDRAANNRTTSRMMYDGMEFTIQDVDGVDMFVIDGTFTDSETMKVLVKAVIATGKTHILVTGKTLAVDSSTYRTLVSEAISQREITSPISLILRDATSIGYKAFMNCEALTSLTFGSVITNVGSNAFGSASDNIEEWTSKCDLVLAAGQRHMTEATDETPGTPNGTAVTSDETTWAGKTWKSITIKNTNE